MAILVGTEPADFTPYYLQSDALEAGYRAFKKGDLARAEKAVREAVSGTAQDRELNAAARYLLARILGDRAKRAGKKKKETLSVERIAVLHGLADHAPLAGPVNYALARHYEKEGKAARAEQHYERIPRGSAHFVLARIAIAETYLARKGQAEKALGVVDETDRGYPSPHEHAKLELLRGRALAKLGRRSEAVAVFRDLWAQHPSSAMALKAAEELSRLGDPPSQSDRVVTVFSRIDRGSRARLLGQIRSMRSRYPKASRAAWQYATAVAHSTSAEHIGLAPAALRKALARAGPSGRSGFVKGHAFFRLGLVLEELEKPKMALEVYRDMVQALPQHPLAPDALGEAARIARELGDEALSGKLLGALVEKYPRHPRHVEHVWRLGWDAWRTGRPDRAASHFDRIAREAATRRHLGQATWGERALYWRGRAEDASGQRARALRTWEDLVTRYPLTYYSHMAFNRVLERDEKLGARLRPHRALEPYDLRTLVDLEKLDIRRSAEIDTAVELTRLGLYDEAREELGVRARAHALGPDGMTLFASLALREGRLGDTQKLVRWRGTLPRYPDEADERLWKLAYPLPYWDIIKGNAEKSGVDPFLVVALIRHESGYEPKAISRANARGLMQLMPGTAATVARRLFGEPAPSKRSIHEPEVNIRLGTRLLAEQLTLFRDNEALVLAAYNAGSGRMRSWLRKARESKLTHTDELVEEIPFGETHGYVKSVIASWGAYRYVYGPRGTGQHRSVPVEAELPEELGPYFSGK